MKHTQGKWDFTKEHALLRIKQGKKYIATAHGLHGLEDGKDNASRIIEAEANAKLIAAAPELLEALKVVTENFPENVIEDQCGEDAQKIFNAIKKATL